MLRGALVHAAGAVWNWLVCLKRTDGHRKTPPEAEAAGTFGVATWGKRGRVRRRREAVQSVVERGVGRATVAGQAGRPNGQAVQLGRSNRGEGSLSMRGCGDVAKTRACGPVAGSEGVRRCRRRAGAPALPVFRRRRVHSALPHWPQPLPPPHAFTLYSVVALLYLE
jgi:hypothetical protein